MSADNKPRAERQSVPNASTDETDQRVSHRPLVLSASDEPRESCVQGTCLRENCPTCEKLDAEACPTCRYTVCRCDEPQVVYDYGLGLGSPPGEELKQYAQRFARAMNALSPASDEPRDVEEPSQFTPCVGPFAEPIVLGDEPRDVGDKEIASANRDRLHYWTGRIVHELTLKNAPIVADVLAEVARQDAEDGPLLPDVKDVYLHGLPRRNREQKARDNIAAAAYAIREALRLKAGGA